MNRFALAVIGLLAGCAAQPECLRITTVGITVSSTDARILPVTITPATTTVCVTPASIDKVPPR